MTEFTLTLVASFGVGMLGVLLLRHLPTLSLQLTGLSLLAVALPLVSGLVMFQMHADLKVLALACGAAASVLICAFALTRSIGRRVNGLRRAAQQLSHGDLDARATTRGPAELSELAKAFNEMASNIHQLFESRRQLVAAASHDLRTPIAAIEAMHEAIEDGLVDADHYLPALREQARALRVLVDGLFELARIDARSIRPDVQLASLDEVVEGGLRAFTAEALTHKVDFETGFDPTMPQIRCARDQIRRVLANLLANALRFSPSGGTIRVRTHALADEVLVLVEDDANGLSPAAQERMFERFWREIALAHRAKTPVSASRLPKDLSKRTVAAFGPRSALRAAHESALASPQQQRRTRLSSVETRFPATPATRAAAAQPDTWKVISAPRSATESRPEAQDSP